MSAFLHDVPEAEYHARPEVSQSQLKTLLDCPARFQYERTHGRPHRDAFDLGHAAHAVILGAGDPLAVIDADDWRGKGAREARDAARADGQTPLLRKDYDRVQAMAAAVLEHPAAAAILGRPGQTEVSMTWDADGVPMRGRIDRATTTADGEPVLVDLKSTLSAAPERFARSVYDYGYHLQRAAYSDGWEQVTGEAPSAFIFIAVEKEAPHLTAVYELDATAVRIGEDRYRQALATYRECVATDTWPAYGSDITILPSPRWAA